MAFLIDPKSILLAASLLTGGAITVQATESAPPVDATPATEIAEAEMSGDEREIVEELELRVEMDASAIDGLEAVEAEVAANTEDEPSAHPGRGARADGGKGAAHRSERATAALARAAARSPMSNRGAAHRAERAQDSIEARGPASDDRGSSSVERGERGRSGEHGRSAARGMNR